MAKKPTAKPSSKKAAAVSPVDCVYDVCMGSGAIAHIAVTLRDKKEADELAQMLRKCDLLHPEPVSVRERLL